MGSGMMAAIEISPMMVGPQVAGALPRCAPPSYLAPPPSYCAPGGFANPAYSAGTSPQPSIDEHSPPPAHAPVVHTFVDGSAPPPVYSPVCRATGAATAASC